MNDETARNNKITGVWYAIAAFTAWGVLPLYWKALIQVPAGEILAHRILWSFIFVSLILVFNGRWTELKQIISIRTNRLYFFLSAFLISTNWLIYIWAVNENHVVEASLGYYINPLFSVMLGLAVLKERLNFWQLVSFLLAAAGVAIITLHYAKIPWIALSLALTFGLYGLVKKVTQLDSVTGLAMETAVVSPAALLYITFGQINGVGHFGLLSVKVTLLLVISGVVTAMPLLWFAQATKRVPLSTVGFTQYLAPSISLFLGVFIFKEAFTGIHVLSFGFIWSALALYSLSHTKMMAKR